MQVSIKEGGLGRVVNAPVLVNRGRLILDFVIAEFL